MLPGLHIQIHPMKGRAGKAKCFIQYRPIKHPVLPRPALQWMAIPPSSDSASSRNFLMILGLGVVPSVKNSSMCLNPFFMNLYELGFLPLVRTLSD